MYTLVLFLVLPWWYRLASISFYIAVKRIQCFRAFEIFCSQLRWGFFVNLVSRVRFKVSLCSLANIVTGAPVSNIYLVSLPYNSILLYLISLDLYTFRFGCTDWIDSYWSAIVSVSFLLICCSCWVLHALAWRLLSALLVFFCFVGHFCLGVHFWFAQKKQDYVWVSFCPFNFSNFCFPFPCKMLLVGMNSVSWVL